MLSIYCASKSSLWMDHSEGRLWAALEVSGQALRHIPTRITMRKNRIYRTGKSSVDTSLHLVSQFSGCLLLMNHNNYSIYFNTPSHQLRLRTHCTIKYNQGSQCLNNTMQCNEINHIKSIILKTLYKHEVNSKSLKVLFKCEENRANMAVWRKWVSQWKPT